MLLAASTSQKSDNPEQFLSTIRNLPQITNRSPHPFEMKRHMGQISKYMQKKATSKREGNVDE